MSEYVQNSHPDDEYSSPILQNKEAKDAKKRFTASACKVYKIRWAILFMYVLCISSTVMQWIQYSVIADVMVKYYGVSYIAADWTSMIFMLVYIPFSIPGSYLLDKLNLRTVLLLGMSGSSVGAWIKLASVSPDKFWVLLFGQGVVAAFQVLILPVPPKLAAIWFGPKEVSLACGIGMLGAQIGIATGFLMPSTLINSHTTNEATEKRLYSLALGVSIVSTAVFLIIFFFFRATPSTPPSIAQLKALEQERSSFNFFQTLKRLVFHRSYMLLFVAYGLNVGTLNAVSTLLSQIILKYYPNALEDAGRIGCLLTVASMFGSVSCGVVLDKFGRFKETTIILYVITVVTMIIFTFTLDKGIEVIYFIAILMGFSLAGVLVVGLELSAELTYPEPEGVPAGVLTSESQGFGIILVYLYSYLFYSVGDIWANTTLSGILCFGLVLIVCIRYDLRRQAAQLIDARN